MTNTGYSESSQVSMYNTYQNRVATARESYNRAVLNYDNAIKEARLQNNAALAEIAYKALQEQLELSLQGFQYKNQLVLDKANKRTEVERDYYGRYQDVLKQINTENAMAEEIRQYNEQMAFQREQFEEEKRQFNEQMAYQKSRSSGGGGGSSGSSGGSKSSSKSSSSKQSSTIKKSSAKGGDIKAVAADDGGAKIDTKSVVKAGLAGSSGDTIAAAVAKGTHTATKKGNSIVVKRNPKHLTNSLKPENWLKRKL
jgi:hypothetical protein